MRTEHRGGSHTVFSLLALFHPTYKFTFSVPTLSEPAFASPLASPTMRDEAEPEWTWTATALYYPNALLSVLREMVDVTILARPAMLAMVGVIVLGMLAFHTPYIYLAARTREQPDVDKDDVAMLLAFIGGRAVQLVAFTS